jgi:hypothetical protein
MACRPGPLRVERSLRDLYTPFGLGLAVVAERIFAPIIGRPRAKPVYPHEVGWYHQT